MNPYQSTLHKLERKQSVIGIIGLGYVGIPLMLRFASVGYRVIGFDIDTRKVDQLNGGESYIAHISGDSIQSARKAGFVATTDFSQAREADALIICVPTPLNKYREPDLSFVVNTMESIKPYLRSGHIVSLESTTYPGTTDEELAPRINECGLRIGENVFLIFSPEREDPGNPSFSTQTIPKVCGGMTSHCLQVGIALYKNVIDKVVPVSSCRTAEMVKLLENIHRAVNIGLVNEMKIVADRMDIDIHEVIRAASTKPFGFTPYYPGPGLGGHCIPIDPFYLTWKARAFGLHTRFIELAGEVNSHMPHWIVSKLTDALNARKQPVNGSKILVLGIAYKKNVDDTRESPAIELMDLLRERGADVHYSDPWISSFPVIRKTRFELKSVDLSPTTLKQFDCVLLATNHDKFDYDMILKYSRLIVDTRGVYLTPADHVVKA